MTIGNPVFCLALYLTDVHFRGELQHVGYGDEQKNQVLTNQNSRNSWCQIVRGTICYRTPPVAASECRRRDINDGIFYNEKEKKSSIAKKVIREIFLLYHSLPFVVTRCHSLPLVVPLVVTRFTTRLSFYKRSFLYCFIRLKSLPNFVHSFLMN